MKLAKNITFVLPFENDEDSIAETVKRLNQCARWFFEDFEILAVAVESSDNSFALLSLLKRTIPNLKPTVSDRGDLAKHAQLNARSAKICYLKSIKELEEMSLIGLLEEAKKACQERGLHVGNGFTLCCKSGNHKEFLPRVKRKNKPPFLSKFTQAFRKLTSLEVEHIS